MVSRDAETETRNLQNVVRSLEQQLTEAHGVIHKYVPRGVNDASTAQEMEEELRALRNELESTKRAYRDQDSVLAQAEEEALALVQTSRIKEQKMREEKAVLENRVVSLESEIARFESDMRGAVGLWKARAEVGNHSLHFS